ncbi:MAG: baseplate J/gp47 family protein [Cyanobacteria bacterium P01_E01_bin.42]
MIAAGETIATVLAECTVPGEIGNDRGIGEINDLIDSLPSGIPASAQNITPSRGGAAIKTDDNLRKRIILAPESFSNAGSAGAYRFHALGASQDIIDVGVRGASLLAPTVNPPASFKADLQLVANGDLDGIDLVEAAIALLNQTPFVMPGTVEIFPLASDGLPSPELKALIESRLNEDKIRPLTDWVKVLNPVEVNFKLEVAIVPEVTADNAIAKARTEQTLQALASELRRGLGRSILVSEIVRSLKSLPEIYDVAIASPAQNVILEAWEWANCSDVVVELASLS